MINRDILDQSAYGPAAQLEQVFIACAQGLGIHPADERFEFLRELRRAFAVHQEIAAADIDIVFQLQDNAKWRKGGLYLAAAGLDMAYMAADAGGKHGDSVAFPPGAAT